MDELDLTAAESKAAYEEIKDYVLEHTGLKVSGLTHWTQFIEKDGEKEPWICYNKCKNLYSQPVITV